MSMEDDVIWELRDKVKNLEKQNQQYREALEKIANEISDGEEGTFHFLRRLRIIASEALKQQSK